MKFSGREDVEAPIDAVFDALCDFEAFERQALRRGADVQRVDGGQGAVVGAHWKVSFKLRGRQRSLDLKLEKMDRPNELVFSGTSPGLEASFDIELLSLSKNRTRMAVSLEMSPKNLATRLLLQSLKLAKGNLMKRFKFRLGQYAKSLEDRLGNS